MPYDDIVLCPCKKSWVPKGFEHQCPHCKGKKPLPDLWAEMCNAKPSYPIDMTTPTNSKPSSLPLTPKKEVVRISLPPKPSAVPTFKLPPPKPSSKDSLSTKKDIEDAFDEFFNPPPAKKKSTEESFDDLYNEMLDRQEGADLREMLDDMVEEERRKDDLTAREVVKAFDAAARKETLVVNLFAGPGAGKSTTAAGLFFELKSRSINCELAAEYAKDLTWEERHRTFQNQVYIFGKQHHRIFRLLGQVDVVITDSPLLLTVVYDGDKRDSLKELVYEEHRKMWTYNAFIKRAKTFNPKGRVHGFDEAMALDNKILDALDDAGELYEVFDGTPEGKDKLVKKVLLLLDWHKTCTALKQ